MPVCYQRQLMNYRISSRRRPASPNSRRPPTNSSNTPRRPRRTARRAAWRSATPRATATAGCIGACGRIGGNLVDKNDKVIINSPETDKALDYAKALYDNFIPGTASWNDAFNNKAFLAGEIYWTNNGISIYVAANNDPTN